MVSTEVCMVKIRDLTLSNVGYLFIMIIAATVLS